MIVTQWAGLACALLAVAMVCTALGAHRRARRRAAEVGGQGEGGSSLIHSAVFGLLGLLLAFTFSQAYGRFQERRALIVEEVNAIGTLHLRLQLLKPAASQKLQGELAEYVKGRIETWDAFGDVPEALRRVERTNRIGEQLWRNTLQETQAESSTVPSMLILPALNAVIDLSTARVAVARAHPPWIVFGLLFSVALFCAALTGIASSRNPNLSLTLPIAFALLTAGTIYLILDIEYPRFGFVNLDTAHALLVEQNEALRKTPS